VDITAAGIFSPHSNLLVAATDARAAGTVTLRRGRQRHAYTVREATPAEAAPVLKRYVTIATRARHRFAATIDAPVEAFIAEATEHPVFELQPPSNPINHTGGPAA
jgi:hypothetical protein